MSDERQGQDHGTVEDQMTNPSIEYMRRIRREEQDKLLGLRRERVTKALRSLDLHGGSHAMLSQIAYAIHQHVGAWDAESCDHLRNVLIELIGGDHEAASGNQRHCACGAGGCDCGHESAEIETERQEAVCKLRKLISGIDDLNSYYQFVEELFDVLGVDDCPDDELCWDDRLITLCDRLIHLLGGGQPRITFDQDVLTITNGKNETRITNDDVIANGMSFADAFDEMTDGAYSRVFRGQSRTCPESEPDVSESDDGTSVTKELREWAKKFGHTWINVVDGTIMHTTADFAPNIDSMKVSDYIIGIADRIDARVAKVDA